MGETGTFKLFCNSADWFGLFEGKFCKSYQKISVLLLLSNSSSNNFPTERLVCVHKNMYKDLWGTLFVKIKYLPFIMHIHTMEHYLAVKMNALMRKDF